MTAIHVYLEVRFLNERLRQHSHIERQAEDSDGDLKWCITPITHDPYLMLANNQTKGHGGSPVIFRRAREVLGSLHRKSPLSATGGNSYPLGKPGNDLGERMLLAKNLCQS